MYSYEPRSDVKALASKLEATVFIAPDDKSSNPRDIEPVGVLVFKPGHWLNDHLAQCDIIQGEMYDRKKSSITGMSAHYFKGCGLNSDDYHVFEIYSYDFMKTALDTNPSIGYSTPAYVVGFAAVPKADFKGDNSRSDAEYALDINLNKLHSWCRGFARKITVRNSNNEVLVEIGDSYDSVELNDKAMAALQEYERSLTAV
ncbi:hypothetical protein [uncultured Psychrobacter sp.]|uniref:hypothetical protein n=1 Tax=uncultured Psychrobacter sp. TaxID=259303 RepID=UPI0030DB9717